MTDATKPSEKKPVAAKKRARQGVPTGAARGRPFKQHLDLSSSTEAVPRLIITGRGQLGNRAMHALRLPTDLVQQLKSLASGPTYLLVQIAIERLCEDLRNQDPGQIKVVKAEDLG